MKVTPTNIPDVILFEPQVFGDDRGFFIETFRQSTFDNLGIDAKFVQDNHSSSSKGVLRGLHYQIQKPQGKLVRVIAGEVYDVAVDLRKSSPTFGQHVGVHLSADNKQIFWVPPGFAHGFLVLSDMAEFVYKCTEYYSPEYERSLIWNDPNLDIKWPIKEPPDMSKKDLAGQLLTEVELFQ